ncbi:hypothetical protein Tco_1081686 [Tanacetum coccineum]|uniref:Uncharacterized protein n=1 Tax=Tanacetum coccineum TaxID=301880 RepID=A0ABQ5HYB5_9ASTR
MLRHEKNELAWGEKYEFQNYELKCKELKIDNLKMELEKVVKERDELKVKIEKWEESSKGLNKLLNSQMSAKDKNGLGSSLDEYAIRQEIIESKITELNTDTSKSKTSETMIMMKCSEVKKLVPVKTNVIQTVKTQVDKIGQTSQKEGIGFKKIKACFVCKSTDHLIKDCDFYAKKSPEPKLKTVANTSQRVAQNQYDYAEKGKSPKNFKQIPSRKKNFVPSGVLTRTGLVNPVRPNGKRAVHIVSTARPISTARPFAPKIAQTGSAIRLIYPRMDNVRPRASYSPIKRSYYTKPAFRPKNLKQDVKTSRVKNMTTAGTRAVVNTS